jgi:hypothetical protein
MEEDETRGYDTGNTTGAVKYCGDCRDSQHFQPGEHKTPGPTPTPCGIACYSVAPEFRQWRLGYIPWSSLKMTS